VPSDCTLIKDPKDECCRILDCEKRVENTTSIIDLKSRDNHLNGYSNVSKINKIDTSGEFIC
jgi:phosphoribosylaminoimidazole (AIR) synthetase